MTRILAAILLTASAGIALADSVPRIDYEASCRAAEKATAGLLGTVDACRTSELAARDTLVTQWSGFAAADRNSCYSLTTTGTPGTYTELLTCLEMRKQVRTLPAYNSTVGLGSSR